MIGAHFAFQVRRRINRIVGDQIVGHHIDITGDDDHRRSGRAGVERCRTCGFDDLRLSRDERLHGARAALDKHDLHVESLPLKKTRVLGDPKRGRAPDRHGLIGSRHLIGGTCGPSGGEKNQGESDEAEWSVYGSPSRRLRIDS